MAIATVDDVADRAGRPLTTEERTWAAVLLDDVEARLETRIPDLHERVDESPRYRRLVVQVEVAAVLRVLSNPESPKAITAIPSAQRLRPVTFSSWIRNGRCWVARGARGRLNQSFGSTAVTRIRGPRGSGGRESVRQWPGRGGHLSRGHHHG